MGDSTRRRRVSRRERWAWSGAWGWRGELPDARGLGQLELGQDGALGAGELGALAEGPGGAGEGAELDAFQLLAEAWSGVAAGGLDGAGQQQRQQAQDDVGADALLLAVVDRAQVDHLLHVAPAAFDLQQLLVAKRDLLGRQVRVRAAQQVLAVEVGLGLDGPLVGAQQPAGRDAQVAVEPRLGGQYSAQLGPLGRAELVGAGDRLGELGQQPGADGGVAVGLLGVVADDEPVVLGDADLLDPQVVGHLLVAALAFEGGGRLGGARPQSLADDVVVVAAPEESAVLRRGEAAVGHPDDPGQGPVPQVGLDLADQGLVAGVARPAPHPHWDAGAGDRHADHDLRQVVAVVLGVAVAANPTPVTSSAAAASLPLGSRWPR